MNYLISLFLYLLLILFNIEVSAKEISLSFDDAPRRNSSYFKGSKRTEMIINKLKKHGVKRAAFYVNTNRFKIHKGLERIKKYKEAGHLIGNHSHSHLNLKKVSMKKYIDDFIEADKILKREKLLDLFYRYPFLRRGVSAKDRDLFYKELTKRNYVDAFVNVDNYDFYMEYLFAQAIRKKENIDFSQLKKFYVETLFQGILFFEELAQKTFGKTVKHVLLLHENDLAALFIGDLINHLRSKGWRIISPEDSYSDPLTQTMPLNTLKHGSGRISAIAASRGYQGALRSKYENENFLEKLFVKYKIIKNN